MIHLQACIRKGGNYNRDGDVGGYVHGDWKNNQEGLV